MNKKVIIIVFALIMTVAYVDLVDSFKHFENIMSQMIKLDSEIKTKVDVVPLKTQK